MSLGEELRRARESSGYSLAELAALTSIRPGLISEMESNNFLNCGGDTYARGHIKTIANLVGADAEYLLDMYMQEHAIEKRNIHEMLAENNVTRVPREAKTLSWKVPAAVSVAILVVVALVQIVVSNTQKVSIPKPETSQTSNVSVTETSTSTATASATPVSTSQGVTLVVVAARGTSRIDIVLDGKHVEKGSILQGETKSYSSSGPISIYFNNPAALDVTVNGVLQAPLGGENVEVRHTFRP